MLSLLNLYTRSLYSNLFNLNEILFQSMNLMKELVVHVLMFLVLLNQRKQDQELLF